MAFELNGQLLTDVLGSFGPSIFGMSGDQAQMHRGAYQNIQQKQAAQKSAEAKNQAMKSNYMAVMMWEKAGFDPEALPKILELNPGSSMDGILPVAQQYGAMKKEQAAQKQNAQQTSNLQDIMQTPAINPMASTVKPGEGELLQAMHTQPNADRDMLRSKGLGRDDLLAQILGDKQAMYGAGLDRQTRGQTVDDKYGAEQSFFKDLGMGRGQEIKTRPGLAPEGFGNIKTTGQPSTQWQETTDQYGNNILIDPATGNKKKVTGPPSNTSVSIDKDGNISFNQGPGVAGFSKPTRGKIEEKLFRTQEGLARLNDIQSKFDRDYLTFSGKAKSIGTDLMDKFNMNPSQENIDFMNNQTAFAQDAYRNLNTMLNELSGAAINKDEFSRLSMQEPSPGKLLTGDGPQKFKTKLDNSIRGAKMAIARYNYYLKEGLTEQQAKSKVTQTGAGAKSLDEMPKVIKDRALQLTTMLKGTVPDAQLKQAVQEKLKSEFGL